MTTAKWSVVIVAAGAGKRFGSAIPKQFTSLCGKPVVDYSIEAFRNAGFDNITVIVPADRGSWMTFWTPPDDIEVVTGGSRRQDSVLNGLTHLHSPDFVLIHDAVRPLISQEVIERVKSGTTQTGACIPVLEIADTVKFLTQDGYIKETIARDKLRISQTPQGFEYSLICNALKDTGDVTDESSAVEAIGRKVVTVEGDSRNMKLTTMSDLSLIESLCDRNTTEDRVGTGLDYHPFTPDKPLMLGGLRLSESGGLLGHSDGDVVLHSIADALLAAVRSGDIGVLFPPTDCKWKDADSGKLLQTVIRKTRKAGWEVKQVDITVIGERPKISPIRKQMVERIGELLSIPTENIWIKGTTTNTLGELGNGTGLACFSLVTLTRNSNQE